MLRVQAGWVYPVAAPPIHDGAVLVDDRGTIAAVGPDTTVPRPEGARSLAFPGGALMPGLVNCHTHLELTRFAGRVNEPTFPLWIRSLRAMKDATTEEEFTRAAEQGVRDCWAAGVTCVADTGSTGAAMQALHALGGRGIAYQEVFGPDPAQEPASIAELTAALDRLRTLASERLRVGVSPHAPYTVSAPLYRASVALARRENLPLAVHVAESPAESELVRHGTGPFADALRARGIAIDARHVSPIRFLVDLGVMDLGGCLCIHCVQADPADVALLKRVDACVAHCPRSNRDHGHGRAPLAAFRSAGIPVGLGTDSVVSTGDVELWREAHAAGLGPEAAIRMLTLEGARALGLETQIGSLEVGKQGDVAVFPVTTRPPHHPTAASPDRLTVAPPTAAHLTVVAGRVVHELH